MAIPPIIDRSILAGDLCTFLHSDVAVDDVFVEVDSGMIVEVVTGTSAVGRAGFRLGGRGVC